MSDKPKVKTQLIFQGLSSEDLHYVAAALDRDAFVIREATDWEELTRRATEENVGLVFLFSESADEIIKSLHQAKGSSKAVWLLGVRTPARSFFTKAKEAGAAEVLVYPFLSGYLIHKIKKHLQIPQTEKKYYEADIKFRLRRKWPKLSAKTLNDWTASGVDLEGHLVHLFQELLREVNFAQDELVFGTFGVTSPVISYPSADFHILLSNDDSHRKAVAQKARDVTDVYAQSLEGAAFAMTVSAEETLVNFPLFTGDRLHGFVRWRHRGAWGPECEQLASDIYAYIEEMGPLLRRFDYLSRLSQGIKKEAV